MQSSFERLYQAAANPEELALAYDGLLKSLFQNPLWESGTTDLQRVPWKQGHNALTQDPEVFESGGLYLWGIKDRPLYLGKTATTFRKRFSRYIWSDRSQCNLAQTYAAALVSDGLSGFPVEIREWYKRNFRGSKVRLEGAVRFAKEGIDEIWFALFPAAISKRGEIRMLERALIPVAERWNLSHCPSSPLLNKSG